MRIRYFFVNRADSSPNSLLWQDAPRPLRIRHVRRRLRDMRVTDAHSHLRFLDKIAGERVWLDITNDDVECPLSAGAVVDVKIVQQFRPGSQAFLSDLFGSTSADSYPDLLRRFRRALGLGPLGSGPAREGRGQEPASEPQAPVSGYVKFKSEDDFDGNGDEGNADETEEINEDMDKFDIKFDESQVEDKPSDNIDFLNDTVDPSFAPKARTDSKDMGEFANLMDSDVVRPTTEAPAKEGILNLDLGQDTATQSAHKTAHEIQIDAQQQKLVFANEIDPKVAEWSKDPSTGTVKDIRSLLISLRPFLQTYNIEFEQIMLSQVMSKGAVRKMYFKVIRRIHPDKTNETDPKILYMFERMTEIINNAFKKHKSMA